MTLPRIRSRTGRRRHGCRRPAAQPRGRAGAAAGRGALRQRRVRASGRPHPGASFLRSCSTSVSTTRSKNMCVRASWLQADPVDGAFPVATPRSRNWAACAISPTWSTARRRRANAPDYARMVYDLAWRRDLIRMGGDMAKAASDDAEHEAREQIETAEQLLYELAEHGAASSNGFMPFATALERRGEDDGRSVRARRRSRRCRHRPDRSR